MNPFRKSIAPGRLGVEVGPFGLAVAHVDQASGHSRGACRCAMLEGTELDDLAGQLRHWIAEQGLGRVACSVVLHPAFYSIYFVERPDVEEEDLAEAVQWKIKDLLDTPVADLVFDTFPIPDDAFHGRSRMIYVIAANRALMLEFAEAIEEAGLEPDSINITELAMRNIVAMLEEDVVGGSALLRMRNSEGMLSLSHSGSLYVTRHVDTSVSVIDSADESERMRVYDELLLEVQRSLDYFDAQVGKGMVRNFLLAPMRLHAEAVQAHLRDNLGVSIHELNLNHLFDTAEEIPMELQAQCFAAVGAACVST